MKKSLLSLIIFMTLSINGLFACSCYKTSVEKNFNGSDLVFIGQVIEVNKQRIIDSIPIKSRKNEYDIRTYNRIEFKFKILELFKGDPQLDFISIYTTGGIADCGNYFQLDSKHIVYSFIKDIRLPDFSSDRKVDPYFTTSTCTHTKSLKKLKRRERKLIETLGE